MKAVLLAITLILTSCTTTFYKNGEKIASFAGDMTNSRVEISDTGAVRWSADKVSHSTATSAAGRSITNGVVATGSVVTAATAKSYFR